MCFLVIYIQPFLLLTLQKCLSEVRGPLVDLGVSEYGILSAITTLSETQNDLGANQQQTSASTQLSYSVDDITLFRQIALDLRKFSPGLVLMSDGTVSKGILATQMHTSWQACSRISESTCPLLLPLIIFHVSQSAPSQHTALWWGTAQRPLRVRQNSSGCSSPMQNTVHLLGTAKV